MDYNGPIWVHGCHPRKERQRFIWISPAFPPSALVQHCSTSVNIAFLWYVCTMCFAVLFDFCAVLCFAVQCVVHTVKWTPCSVINYITYKCTNCRAKCTLLCYVVLCPVLIGSDAPLPHLPSLDSKESALPKWGSFSPLQLSPPTTIVIVFEIQFSQSWAEKLAASQLDANAVTSFWAQWEFHLDMIWPSSEVSSESSTPVMSS